MIDADDSNSVEWEQLSMAGTLAAGLGHDLRNAVMPILLRLDVLDIASELPPSARVELAHVRAGVERIQRLAAGLRLLASGASDDRHERHTARLDHWWADVSALVRATLPANVVLRADRLPEVEVAVSPAVLTQVVLILTMNARSAMSQTTNPALSVTATRVDDTIELAIGDNGAGMSPESRRRCFEPYFTTGPRTEGTGLGLSTGRALLRRFHGDLLLQPPTQSGATFVMRLPLLATMLEQAVRPKRVLVALREARQRAVVWLLLSPHYELVDAAGRSDADLDVADVLICEAGDLPHRAAQMVRQVIAVGDERAEQTDSRVIRVAVSQLADIPTLLA
jgi:signal transduction histidine kinase